MRLPRMLRLVTATLIAVSALGAGLTFAVDAGATGSSTTYYACLKGGKLTAVGTTPPTCSSSSTQISWNSEGAQGATGAAGPQGPAGPQGATGSTGPAGAAGPAGTNGNTVLNGSGPPASTLGNIGDFYIDTSAHEIYGPKEELICGPFCLAPGWPAGTSLVGPQGAAGPAGPTVQGGYSNAGVQGIGTTWTPVAAMTIQNAGGYAVFAKAQISDTDSAYPSTGNTNASVNCELFDTDDASDPGVDETLPFVTPGELATGVSLMYTNPTISAGATVTLQCRVLNSNEQLSVTNVKIIAIEASNLLTDAL